MLRTYSAVIQESCMIVVVQDSTCTCTRYRSALPSSTYRTGTVIQVPAGDPGMGTVPVQRSCTVKSIYQKGSMSKYQVGYW